MKGTLTKMHWVWNHGFWREETRNRMTDSQMWKVKFGQRLKARIKQAGVGVPFVIMYHPKLKKMKKLKHLLYQNESVKRVFTPPPMVSHRNARKLSNYSVRSKLYPLGRKRGSYKCGDSRCQVCNNIEETDTFTALSQALLQVNNLR